MKEKIQFITTIEAKYSNKKERAALIRNIKRDRVIAEWMVSGNSGSYTLKKVELKN